ncbi:MAG: tripartite tricarboxylate transporter substrate binding protein [Treponema sp.]
MKKTNVVVAAAAAMMLLAGCMKKDAGTASSAHDGAAWKPAKDVNVIVAYKAGSGTDTGARILCSIAEKYVGETLVVVNKEGADGKIGYTALANARPDGYTIGFINLPTFNSLAAEENSSFTVDSIVPIVNHLFEPSVVVVRKDAPWNTIEDLIAYCKDHPNEVKCSTNGVKASNHIGAQLLAKSAGFVFSCIPYGGTADQLLALRQGEVQVSVPKAGDITSLIGENGELKVLASFTEERLADLQEVPTLKEKGYNLVYGSARALVAPKGTPQNIIDFYVEAFKKTMEDPDNIQKSKNAGLSLNFMSPEALGTFIDKEDDFVKNTLPKLFD